jgi:hypothetical protein
MRAGEDGGGCRVRDREHAFQKAQASRRTSIESAMLDIISVWIRTRAQVCRLDQKTRT